MRIHFELKTEADRVAFDAFAIALTGAIVGGQLVTEVACDAKADEGATGRIVTTPGENTLVGGQWLYHELPNPKSFRAGQVGAPLPGFTTL